MFHVFAPKLKTLVVFFILSLLFILFCLKLLFNTLKIRVKTESLFNTRYEPVALQRVLCDILI